MKKGKVGFPDEYLLPNGKASEAYSNFPLFLIQRLDKLH